MHGILKFQVDETIKFPKDQLIKFDEHHHCINFGLMKMLNQEENVCKRAISKWLVDGIDFYPKKLHKSLILACKYWHIEIVRFLISGEN